MSEAWLEALTERLKCSEAYKKAARDWRASMALALLPEPEKDIAACAVVLDLQQGECRSAARVAGPGPYEADYVIRGVAENWRLLLTRAIFPVPALMKGDLQLVKGSTTSLMMKMPAAQALLDDAGAVPTRYPA